MKCGLREGRRETAEQRGHERKVFSATIRSTD